MAKQGSTLIHPNAESMEYHLKLSTEKGSDVFDYIDVESVELSGPRTWRSRSG